MAPLSLSSPIQTPLSPSFLALCRLLLELIKKNRFVDNKPVLALVQTAISIEQYLDPSIMEEDWHAAFRCLYDGVFALYEGVRKCPVMLNVFVASRVSKELRDLSMDAERLLSALFVFLLHGAALP